MAKAPFGALWQFQLCVLSASSIIMERNLAIFISFSRKNSSGPQTFILLRQPGKCKIGVSPLAEEMLSPQPGACLLLFTPRVVQDGLLEMQLSGPNLDKLNQTLHLNKSPQVTMCTLQCEKCWPRGQRISESRSHLWNWNVKSRRLVGWFLAFTLGSGAGHSAGSLHQTATGCVWAEAEN